MTTSMKKIAMKLDPSADANLSDSDYLKWIENKVASLDEDDKDLLIVYLQRWILERATSKTKEGLDLSEFNLKELISTVKKLIKKNLPTPDEDDDDEEVVVTRRTTRGRRNPCTGLKANDCKANDDCSWRYYGTASKRSCGAKPGRYFGKGTTTTTTTKKMGPLERRLSASRPRSLERCAVLPRKKDCISDPNCIWNTGRRSCGGRSGTVKYGHEFQFDNDENIELIGRRKGWKPSNPYGGEWSDGWKL